MMASFMAAPHQGHLDQVQHIFAYLKNKHNCEMVFDPTQPDIILRVIFLERIGVVQFIMESRKFYHLTHRKVEVRDL